MQNVRYLIQEQGFRTVALYIHKRMCTVDQAAISAAVMSADTQLAKDVLPAAAAACWEVCAWPAEKKRMLPSIKQPHAAWLDACDHDIDHEKITHRRKTLHTRSGEVR
jgi:hypothetical protein